MSRSPQKGILTMTLIFAKVKDVLPGLRTGEMALIMDYLGLDGGKEAFHHIVVVAIARTTHANRAIPPSQIIAFYSNLPKRSHYTANI